MLLKVLKTGNIKLQYGEIRLFDKNLVGFERFQVEEVPQNMYCIWSVIEYIIMEVSQNISLYTYSVTLAYNMISIMIYLKTPVLQSIFKNTWSWSIFIDTSSTSSRVFLTQKSKRVSTLVTRVRHSLKKNIYDACTTGVTEYQNSNRNSFKKFIFPFI